ncbi:cell wall protein [Fusarium heterosporum]|uniref:Cell wall protein n=1 Tax=Fusarium heterosporum TaxID=42747 RepID=A0A8H5WR25_FUSHE|nr:cell wall protein [Fusarium heterosporum]
MRPTYRMKICIILTAASLVAAQKISDQPECARKCLQENIRKAGCDLDDTACQCDSKFQENIQPIIVPCLAQACEATDILEVQSAAVEACANFSLTSRIEISTRSLDDILDVSSAISEDPAIAKNSAFLTSVTETSPVTANTAEATLSANRDTESSKAWIAGPVVGGIIGLVLLLIGAYLFGRRRANRNGVEDRDGSEGRYQLHSDSMNVSSPEKGHFPAVHEMHGSTPQPAEMAVNEVPASELPSENTKRML